MPALLAAGACAIAVGAHSLANRPGAASVSLPVPASASPARGQDVAAAVTALQRALVLRQQVLVPPGQHPGAPASAADLAGMTNRAATLLPSAFSGAALDKERTTVQNAVSRLSGPDVQCTGGGADQFALDTPAATADGGLRFTGSYRAWSDVAQLRGGTTVTAVASNTLKFTASMAQFDGAWKVTDFTWTFQPGSEP